ncbi:MAG: bifunctional tetrahydrofolate synthase/dihydrofolate synthase [Rhodocyclaceae bacterium]|nr:bifunctional tetrahydrofolate synthase/dihydrofolate synthase [Rhodocyclaceae bacterium]
MPTQDEVVQLPRTLDDWLTLLESRHPLGADGIELGLNRVAAIKLKLDQRETCPVILVAGTNGKGSCCAMLESILINAGYRVGLYSSPHLVSYNERIRVNASAVADDDLCAAFAKVETARGEVFLSYFEAGTLAAWEVFATQALDVIVLEVGLGGRLDATNIYQAACTLVTTIDLDHQALLGKDREAIGFEKAGIFRAGVPAVCGDAKPPQSLLERAAVVGAPLRLMGRDFGYMPQEQQWQYWCFSDGRVNREVVRRSGMAYPGLRGSNQLANAASVLAVLDALSDILPVAMKDVRQGLMEISLPGRFQVLPGRPVMVLDVAHNQQAARVLSDNLGGMGFHPCTWAVFGIMADKDIDEVIDSLKDRITYWLPCDLPGRRAIDGKALAAILDRHHVTVAGPCSDVLASLKYARDNANLDDRILVFGSFLTVAAALKSMGRAE